MIHAPLWKKRRHWKRRRRPPQTQHATERRQPNGLITTICWARPYRSQRSTAKTRTSINRWVRRRLLNIALRIANLKGALLSKPKREYKTKRCEPFSPLIYMKRQLTECFVKA